MIPGMENLLEHFKSMPAGRKENDVASFQYAAFKILLILAVEVDPQFSTFNEKNLFGVLNLPI